MCDKVDGCCPVTRPVEPGRAAYKFQRLGRNTVYKFTAPFAIGATTTFDAEVGGGVRAGDTLTLIFRADIGCTFHLSEAFFYTACGDLRDQVAYAARNAMQFIFDGELWVSAGANIC